MTTTTTEAIVENNNAKDIDKPSIWVACLSAYNSGYLHGAWIVPKTTKEELLEQIKEVLKGSPVGDPEEWAIHDYNNFPDLGEYPDLEKVCEVQEALEEFEPSVVRGYLSNFCQWDTGTLKDDIEEAFVGTFSNFREYADQTAEETMLVECPEHISHYFDYEAFARDLELDHWKADGDDYDTHIFRSI